MVGDPACALQATRTANHSRSARRPGLFCARFRITSGCAAIAKFRPVVSPIASDSRPAHGSAKPPTAGPVRHMTAKFPGIPTVIHGNGAVAQVMGHVCGGVIGYPITPSTEISELYEASRAERRLQCLGQAPVLLRAGGRALRPERRARRGADRRQVHFQRLLEPGHPVRAGVALRHRRQEDRRLRAAGGGARGLAALAQRDGGPRRRLRAAAVRLHDPVRRQPAGSGRPRRHLLRASARCR